MNNQGRANMKPQRGDKADQHTAPNEGEGSRTADRNYREGVAQHVKSGRSEKAAEEAKQALEGDEGDELRRAGEEAKQRADAHPNVDSPVVPDPD
jgi:hypothetical protein